MLREQLIIVGTCDIAGPCAARAFRRASLLPRVNTGIGWTHSNLMQVCFGPIFDTPFGAVATS